MNWHERFLQQARWTGELRSYFFDKAGLKNARKVLEVGCGTGAVLRDLETAACLHGLDLDAARLLEARIHAPQAYLACGDALSLPYPTGRFDISFCHFLLLWVKDPLQALVEMKRVTRVGGAVLALAEPDHNARSDKPDSLADLGRWQTDSLRRQGADPAVGKQLADLFRKAGITIRETGTLQAGKQSLLTPADRELEWAVLESDLAGSVPRIELNKLKMLDQEAWENGTRQLHVPMFFASGVV